MKLRGILMVMLLSISSIVTAQKLGLKELPISVAFYGENGIHPGVKVGTSYIVRSRFKRKRYRLKGREAKYGEKFKLKELSLDYNLGFYSHPNNHTGFLTNVGMTYLRTRARKSRQLGLALEVGYLRRVNKLKTFTLNDQGEIKELSFAGNNALVIGLSPVFAKEFVAKSARFFVKPTLQGLMYNHTWVPNATIEIGLVLNIHRKKKYNESL